MIHKVTKVIALPNYELLAVFEDESVRYYDMKPLIEISTVFNPLKDKTVFELAHASDSGYGVIWTDAIDLSCDDLWYDGYTKSQLVAC